MLHNFCNDSAPRHVRDFYLARLYRHANPTEMSAYHRLDQNEAEQDDRAQRYVTLPRTRPRGDDGRFVPRADEDPPLDNRDRKVCGWCRTTTTSQWRVGPTNGSVEMGTLCNACGINYRRALAKSPGGTLNLDRLAEQMGHTRLSIQKALKRQRKLSAPAHQFKRTRTVTRPTDRFTHSTDRYGLQTRLPMSSSHSTLNMLLSEDAVRGQELAPVRQPAVATALDSPVFPVAPVAPVAPVTPVTNARYVAQSVGMGTAAVPTMDYAAAVEQVAVAEQHVDRMGSHMREDEQSRLPPFEAFIGDLERRRPM